MNQPTPSTTPLASELTPEALRVICAEEMGLKPIKSHPLTPVHPGVPNFVADANAAMSLVKKLSTEGWIWRCENTGGVFAAYFLQLGSDRDVSATAHSLSLAIARAFAIATGRTK